MSETVFNNFEEAIRYVIDCLIPKRRNYIINVRGPREIASSKATTIQIVSEDMVYGNGKVGLTIHLPFDPASGEITHLAEFLGTELDELCDEYTYDEIPCFALRLGTNIALAEQVTRYILLNIYEYPDFAGFQFEIHDGGSVED